jgi:HSP20 family protein
MLTTWDAVSTLDRMLDDVMGSTLGTATNSRTFQAAIDVRANDDAVVFVCDVPGVRRDDLEITLENRVLTIRGTRKPDVAQNEQVMLGRAYGSFSRSYTLPDSVDDSKLAADLADGVLTIRIPKLAKAKPRRIQIGGGAGGAKQLGEGR